MQTVKRTGPFGPPPARPTKGTSDPAALAAQINAEDAAKPTPSEWLAKLLCPAMNPNYHFGGQWSDLEHRRTIAQVKTNSDGGARVTLNIYNDDGGLAETLTGTGPTVRAAYADAHHQHRRAQHAIEDLHRQRCRAIRRCLALRSRLYLAGQIADLALATNDELLAKNVTLQGELEKATGVITRLEAHLKQAKGRVSDLEHDGLEKDKGTAQIRQALTDAGITEGRLDERVETLAQDRDTWKQRALAAEARLKPDRLFAALDQTLTTTERTAAVRAITGADPAPSAR